MCARARASVCTHVGYFSSNVSIHIHLFYLYIHTHTHTHTHHENIKNKNTSDTTVISDKADLKINIIGDKERHFRMIKGSIY